MTTRSMFVALAVITHVPGSTLATAEALAGQRFDATRISLAKMKTLIMMVAAAAMTLQARQTKPAGEDTVAIYLEIPMTPKDDLRVKAWVKQMFASAGVRIVWRDGAPPVSTIAGERPITVHFVLHTPASEHQGALAFSLPYEGRSVTVFYDRVLQESRQRAQLVLAHVLVHEITHLLERISRHSETGIMKAHWTAGDCYAMTWGPLRFTATDIALIHAGLNVKEPSAAGPSVASRAARATEPISLR